MRALLFILLASLCLTAGASVTNIAPSGVEVNPYMQIRILDQRLLSYPNIDGQHFSEISDLAYDREKKQLYLLSDEGKYFVFEATFGDRLSAMTPLRAVKLVEKNGREFRHWRHDSEGMTLDGNGRPLISFEEQAKIGSFGSEGRMIKEHKLPQKLINIKNFRSKNKSLESVALHPKYGILTACEYPLKKYDKREQTIYSLSGKEWHFLAEEATNSAVVSIEVMDDGNLLILERAYSGLMNPIVITLKKVWLNGATKKGIQKTKVLAKFDSSEGWHVDNFEGLGRVGKNRYAIVSDDNDNFYQQTLLVYFEVLE